MSERTTLYRHWDADGNLLYVGISLNALSRLRQHQSGSHWANDIANVTIETYESRESALEAEEAAIRTEKPKHNIVHANDNHKEIVRRGRKPKTPPDRSVPLEELIDGVECAIDRYGVGDSADYWQIVTITRNTFEWWSRGRSSKYIPSEEYIREAVNTLIERGRIILHNGRAYPAGVHDHYVFDPHGGIIDAPFFPEEQETRCAA